MIFTIGYAGRKLSELVRALRANKVKILVDARRWPSSRWSVYRRERLERSLPRHGIRYVWLPDLGGYRGGYARWARTRHFKAAIAELLALASGTRLCIMCRERGWRGCHRRHIVRLLRARGLKVINLE